VNQEAIIWLKELKFQISLTPDNIMESVSVLDVTNAKLPDLQLFSSAAIAPGFPEYQLLD
jgi:hypothetical protein